MSAANVVIPGDFNTIWILGAVAVPVVFLALLGFVIYIAVRAALRTRHRDEARDRSPYSSGPRPSDDN